jgi:hypothetical protein
MLGASKQRTHDDKPRRLRVNHVFDRAVTAVSRS